MIKKLFLILLILMPLSGCHGNKEQISFNIPNEFDTSKDYEISFWAKNDTNKSQVMIYEKAIDDFEELYPNIKVNMRLYTDYGRIYNDVITNIQTGTTPNICITYPDHIATYLTGDDTIVALDELMSNEKYGLGGSELKFESLHQNQIVDSFLKEGYFANHQYALPFMRSTEACYINKTYVEALGYEIPETLTWDFIFEVSSKAMELNEDGTYKGNNQKVLIPFIYKSTDNMMIQMLYQLNKPYASNDGEVLLFHDTTKEILLKLSDYVGDGLFSTFKISSYPANFLNAGQCLFAIDSTAGATWMGSKAPLSDISEEKYVEFETIVKSIPQFDVDNPKMISQGPSLCLFNKEDPNEVLASWMFMQFLLTNDVQNAYAMTEGYVPVTNKAQNSDIYQEYLNNSGKDNDLHYNIKIDAARLLLENTNNTFVTPVFNGSASLRDASGQLIENVTKSVRRKEVVDDKYIDKLYKDVTALYHLDQIDIQNNGKANLGPLPFESKLLIGTLVSIWTLIVGYTLYNKHKKRNI